MEAIGTASAIVTLLECGIMFYGKAKGVLKVYKDRHALTERDQDLEASAGLFIEDNDRMLARFEQSKSTLGPEEAALKQINIECRDTVRALRQALDSLRVHGDDSRKGRLIFALKAMGNTRQAKVERCERKLSSLHTLLNVRLLGLINVNVTKGLARIEATIEQTQLDFAAQYHHFKHDLLDAIKTQTYDAIAGALKQTRLEVTYLSYRKSILASLKYEEIRKRGSEITAIADSDVKTFEWIFDEEQRPQSNTIRTQPSPVHYMQWLEQEGGAFWVTGKPGCGKSTLMKFISNDSRTHDALRKWAQQRRLITASHYFWYLGTPLQKSCEGLFRALLWEVLRHCPDIIETVCQARWNEAVNGTDANTLPWELDELRGCLAVLGDKVLYSQAQELCFCLFVDGMDEYRGEYHDILQMVEMLQSLANSANVKVCASSRDKPVFRDYFAAKSLELHLHTTEDVKKVVHRELDPHIAKFSRGDRDLTFLISEIVRKAEGVFLWVVLVIRNELLKSLYQNDSVDELRKRLGKVPAGLEEYFRHIFEQIDDDYRCVSARIFLVCSQAYEPLPIDVLELLDSEPYFDDPTAFAKHSELSYDYTWGNLTSITDVHGWVNGRCQELMSVHPSKDHNHEEQNLQHSDGLAKLEFLHRSVVDFLQVPRVHEELCEAAGSGFDVPRFLFAAYIFLLKKAPTFLGPFPERGREMAKSWSMHALLQERDTKQPVDLQLLNDLDQAMTIMFSDRGSKHWTNIVTSSQGAYDSHLCVREQGQRDLIAHVIEFGLVRYATLMLQSAPSAIKNKQGRPYLDYALRSAKNNPWSSHNPQLVLELLSLGCKPNQGVFINDGVTVFDLFIKHIYDKTSLPKQKYRQTIRILIKRGAVQGTSLRQYESASSSTVASRYQQKTISTSGQEMRLSGEISFEQVLTGIVGLEEARVMLRDMARNNGWFSSFWR